MRQHGGGNLLWAGWTAAAMCLLPVGCNRYDYVRDADDQAYQLVAEKSNDPRWEQPGFAVDLDPRSRYFDPYDDISPPMPPDDPYSAQFMQVVDGKKHWPYWDQFGNRPILENPNWKDDLAEYVEVTEEGKVRMGLKDAVRLAYIHNPSYQQNLETLYLSALDVSTERFRFDTQFFGTVLPLYTNIGPNKGRILNGPNATPGRFSTASSQWNNASSLMAKRQLSTAGQVLVGFANSTVWELVGRNSNVSTSLLNFSFIQPLLRAGGRAVALEQLTIVERALLANLRCFERYRQGFFTNIAIGTNGTQGPSRRGGFFGGTGLTGFTGTGSGGFGGVGAATGFGGGFSGGAGGGTGGGAGTTGFAGGGAGTVGGFLGLLQQSQQIRNSQQTLALQINTLELLDNLFQAGEVEIVQVQQFQQNIETERATLLQSQIGFQNSLENYLINTLGLPPELPVELREEFIEPLRFTSEEVLSVQDQLTHIFTDLGKAPKNPSVELLKNYFERTAKIFPETDDLVKSTQEDLKKLAEKAEARKVTMTDPEKAAFDASNKKLSEDLQKAIDELKTSAAALEDLQQKVETAEAKKEADDLTVLLRNMQDSVGGLFQVQVQARLEAITVQEVSLEMDKALEIARTHRLDWMNNRAALVDTWRLIQFNANALKSNVTVTFNGNMGTVGGDNPLKFRADSGTLTASVQFDPPLTRLTERNNFRQQLILYQQSRRQLIQYRDGVYYTLRQLLRGIQQLRVNLEIQRRAVNIAIRRVDQTRSDLNKPVGPVAAGQPPPTKSPTASLNLLNALSDLRNTQNNFLSVYLNYYGSRMLLMRELGLMRLDENGEWIDEPLDLAMASILDCECDEFPPAVPGDWLDPNYVPGLPMDEAPETGEPMKTTPDAKVDQAPETGDLGVPGPAPMENEKPRVPQASLPACKPTQRPGIKGQKPGRGGGDWQKGEGEDWDSHFLTEKSRKSRQLGGRQNRKSNPSWPTGSLGLLGFFVGILKITISRSRPLSSPASDLRPLASDL